jgi:general secretion pathway protein B
MSLILEALRKSEAERRRGQAPDVAMELPPVPVRRTATLPRWWPWLLLGAGLAAATVWWQSRDASPGRVETPAVPVAATAAPEPEPRVVLPAAPAVVVAPGQRVPAVASATPAPRTPPAAADAPIDAPVAPPLPLSPPITAPPPAPVAELPAPTLTSVRLSMHMWDEVPAQRFVILDGQRMVEGDRRGELQVIAIERDGVLVERNGQRARIPLR